VKSPDQKHHLVAQVLKLFHLLQQHRVAEMQVRRGGIEAGLDSKRLACFNGFLQSAGQVFFVDDLRRAAFDDLKLFLGGGHGVVGKGGC